VDGEPGREEGFSTLACSAVEMMDSKAATQAALVLALFLACSNACDVQVWKVVVWNAQTAGPAPLS
jgi:hypothetical protein